MPSDIPMSPARGWTPPELAKLLRVSAQKVRNWIQRGELGAVNVASDLCRRPSYVILPEHFAAWQQKRSATPPPKPKRRRRKPPLVDYFPD